MNVDAVVEKLAREVRIWALKYFFIHGVTIMPNGGSDCCGTCWFNNKNDGVAGYQPHALEKEGNVLCTIRDLVIPDPFWTYCANHPHHNDKIDLPLGPVYVTDGNYGRKFWADPPDDEKSRLRLLGFLDSITDDPKSRYPSETDIEKTESEIAKDIIRKVEGRFYTEANVERSVIEQLTVLKEKRAIAGLKQVVNLDLESYRSLSVLLMRSKTITVAMAIESLLEISDGEAIDEVKHFINKGIEDEGLLSNYSKDDDRFAAVRYHLVRGLRFSQSETARELLKTASHDPHNEVRAFADAIISGKIIVSNLQNSERTTVVKPEFETWSMLITNVIISVIIAAIVTFMVTARLIPNGQELWRAVAVESVICFIMWFAISFISCLFLEWRDYCKELQRYNRSNPELSRKRTTD